MRATLVLGAVLSAFLLSSCASGIPVRTAGLTEAPHCQAVYEAPLQKNNSIADQNNQCWLRAIEERDAYDLLFVEFDDQGLIQGASRAEDEKSDYLDQLFKQLNRLVEKHRQEGISLVIFIHGWHNNAAADNGKVKGFREMLSDFNELEKMNGGRRVVGLYIVGPAKPSQPP